KAGADQRSRLIRWKEVAVILQDDQIVSSDEAVSGVAIYHIHLACRERLVLHRREQRADRAKADAVRLLQPRQAVGPANEIGGEPRPKRAGDPGEIAESCQPETTGGLLTHCDGI